MGLGTRAFLYARGEYAGLSIRWKARLVIALEGPVLVLLAQVAVPYCKYLDACAHEAAKGILWRSHQWLARDVEACVDQDRAPGHGLEPRK